jgi:hypothetical protein
MAKKERWWKVEHELVTDTALATSVFEALQHIMDDKGSQRESSNNFFLGLYSDRIPVDVPVEQFNLPTIPGANLTLNVSSSCCDALAAKVAPNKPKPMYLTSDGDFSAQMKAKNRQRFVMGHFHSENVYRKGRRALQDALQCDIGAMKIVGEKGAKGVRYERVHPNEIHVDEKAAQHGEPRELFQRKLVPTDTLAAVWEDFEDQIFQSATQKTSDSTRGLVDDLVELVEAWHLPSKKDKSDGRHVICVKNAVLLEEPWKDDSFPFAFIRFTELASGFFGLGLVEQLSGIQQEITTLVRRIKKAHDILGVPWVKKPGGCTWKAGSGTNEIGVVMEYDGPEPKVEVHAIMAPEVYSHLNYLFEKAFEVSGISQLSATSRKPAGVESGVALRTLLDTETQRFSLLVEAWQEFYLEIARQTIFAARRCGNPVAKWRSKEWVREIQFSDVDDEDDKFDLQLWPTNLLPDTPAGKLAYVEQMITIGLIGPEQGQSLLDYPDIEAFQRENNAGRDNIEMIVEHMMVHDDYIAPTKFMNLALSKNVIQANLLRAQVNGWPEEKQSMLAQWLDAADAILNPPPPPAPDDAFAASPDVGAPMPPAPGPLQPQTAQPPAPDWPMAQPAMNQPPASPA